MNLSSKHRFADFKIVVRVKASGELTESTIHGMEHAIASASNSTGIPCAVKMLRRIDDCAPGQGVNTVSTTATISLGEIKAKAKITIVFDEHILISTAETMKTLILEHVMIDFVDDLHTAIAIPKTATTMGTLKDILRDEFGDRSASFGQMFSDLTFTGAGSPLS